MARETGLEPAASAVTGRRSNQLSYSRNPESDGRHLERPLSQASEYVMPARPSSCRSAAEARTSAYLLLPANEVALTNLKAVVPQDVVSGCAMEIKIRE